MQTFLNIYTEVASEKYDLAIASCSAAQVAEAKRLTNVGYQSAMAAADWCCLHPQATLTLWASATGTASVSTVTITDSTNKPFLPSMVGHTLVMDTSETEYTISSVTSTSVCVVTADASDDDGDTFTITNDGDFTLPAGFAYMESGPIFNASNSGLSNINQTTPGRILTLRAGSTSGTYPTEWAIRPLTFTTTQGQLWELMLWPSPGSQVVTIQYRLNAADMSSDTEYPVGGNALNLLVRAYALRAVEYSKQTINGPREAQAKEALDAAIAEDHRQRARGTIAITSGPTAHISYDPRLTHLGVTMDGV